MLQSVNHWLKKRRHLCVAAYLLLFAMFKCWLLVRPKIHSYTGCKRTGCIKPGSKKLAMGHLPHSEAAPWNRALQTCVPPWIQCLLCQDLSTLLWHVTQHMCISGGACIGWSIAVDPLSTTVGPLHLTHFAVPFVPIVTTVCLQGMWFYTIFYNTCNA